MAVIFSAAHRPAVDPAPWRHLTRLGRGPGQAIAGLSGDRLLRIDVNRPVWAGRWAFGGWAILARVSAAGATVQ